MALYVARRFLNIAAFKRAWQALIRRHAILRTAFVADGSSEPLQVVLSAITVAWAEYDWQEVSLAEQENRLLGFLDADRKHQFDLARAGLLRFTLIRTADDEYYFIWTTHHLLIDGWSWPVIFNELDSCYRAFCAAAAPILEEPCPYRNYIAWLGQRDRKEAELYWREYLKGISKPSELGLRRDSAETRLPCGGFSEEGMRVADATTTALQTVARQQHITLNTVFQGAWALLLCRFSGDLDVLFGAAYSGRSPDVSGIDRLVGPCVNDLPVRVRLSPDEPLSGFLPRLQAEQFDTSQYQYSSIAEIHAASEIPLRKQMFESLLVFQNYSSGIGSRRLGESIEIATIAVPEASNYPVTIVIVPGDNLYFRLIFRTDRFPAQQMRGVLTDFRLLLESMARIPERSIAEILASLPLYVRGMPPRGESADQTPQLRVLNDDAPQPHTDAEKTVAAVWRALFQTAQINIDSNFFDLGGHSILLVEMHKRLEQALNRRLPVVSLFQHTTVRSLARYINSVPENGTTYQRAVDRAQQQREALAKRTPKVRTN